MKIVKEVVRVGNTGGVLVPREWVNGKAEVRLVEEPLNVERDVLELLKPWLPEVKGVYLVGSYARGEQTARSDVDVLVVTGRTSRKIERGRYQVILIPQMELERQLRESVLPMLPMIIEAKALLNAELLGIYRKTRITARNIRWHLETTASALEVIKEAVALDKEAGQCVSDNIVYSLILRLRGVCIVDSLRRGQVCTTRDLVELVRRLTGSAEAYKAYLRSKDGGRAKRRLSMEDAEKLISYIGERIAAQRRWVEKRG